MAAGAWLCNAGVAVFAAGLAVDLVAGTAFFGAVLATFLAGFAPVPLFGLVVVVSRETSGIRAPKPRPRLCRFAIALTLLLTFGDFAGCS